MAGVSRWCGGADPAGRHFDARPHWRRTEAIRKIPVSGTDDTVERAGARSRSHDEYSRARDVGDVIRAAHGARGCGVRGDGVWAANGFGRRGTDDRAVHQYAPLESAAQTRGERGRSAGKNPGEPVTDVGIPVHRTNRDQTTGGCGRAIRYTDGIRELWVGAGNSSDDI